ncbi:MAG TPA: hypothetical protein VF150_08060, partial [Thermoanaerobaculia bacterium]
MTLPLATAADPRPALLGLPFEGLAAALAPAIDRPFRARQVYDALHRRAAASFDEMTDLPRDLRERLDRDFRIGGTEVVERAASDDGTVKYLL